MRTIDELKQTIDAWSDEERLFVAAYLQHLRRVDDPANADDLANRLEAIESGKKVSLSDLHDLHDGLVARGL